MASSTGTFVSCKDYDDDIEDLQEQLNKKASLEELTQKVSTMESSVADAKKAAEEAKAKAQNSGGRTQNEMEQSTQQRR